MEPLTMQCIAPKCTLMVEGVALISIDKKGQKEVYPFSILQGIRIKAPTALIRGSLELDILKSPTAHLGITAGLSIAIGNEPKTFVYTKDQVESAKAIHEYVVNALASPKTVDSSSFVDELVKLKGLLDQGALSQEEFDAAKAKLLS